MGSVVDTNESIDERVVGRTDLKDAQRSSSKINGPVNVKGRLQVQTQKATQATRAA